MSTEIKNKLEKELEILKTTYKNISNLHDKGLELGDYALAFGRITKLHNECEIIKEFPEYALILSDLLVKADKKNKPK